jgi:hypothetical protein
LLMALNDIIEVQCFMAGPANEELVNVLHYRQTGYAGNFTLLEMPNLASSIDAVLAPAMIPVLSSDSTYAETRVKILTGASAGFNARNVNHAGSGGTSADNAGSIERALVIRKLTGIATRRARGRLFFPKPGSSTYDTDGRYVPACVDAAAQATLVGVIGNPIDCTSAHALAFASPVIFHRGTVTYTDILTCTISVLVGTQRRRRIGVGV